MPHRLFLLLPLLALFGCGGGSIEPPKTVLVSGTVVKAKKGVDGVRLTFHPQFDAGPIKWLPSATTDKGGKFALSTGAPNNGAPPGEYKVTITWEEFARPGTEDSPNTPGTGKDRLRGAYASAEKTPLRATVEAKDNTIDFKLP